MTLSSSLKKTLSLSHSLSPSLPQPELQFPAVKSKLPRLHFQGFLFTVLLQLAPALNLFCGSCLNRTNPYPTHAHLDVINISPHTNCPSLPRTPCFETLFNMTLLPEASLATPTDRYLSSLVCSPCIPLSPHENPVAYLTDLELCTERTPSQ